MFRQLSFEGLLDLCDKSIHESVKKLARQEFVKGLVVFENQQLDSSNAGQRTILSVGPINTYKSVEECEGKWLGDLPSQRQYAVAYWRKEGQ